MSEVNEKRSQREVGNEYEGGVLLLTMIEAARVLSIGRTTMYELVGAGAIEVVRIGRSVRVPVDALQAFVDQQRVSQ
jgi:excisionase family DNA binding protein